MTAVRTSYADWRNDLQTYKSKHKLTWRMLFQLFEEDWIPSYGQYLAEDGPEPSDRPGTVGYELRNLVRYMSRNLPAAPNLARPGIQELLDDLVASNSPRLSELGVSAIHFRSRPPNDILEVSSIEGSSCISGENGSEIGEQLTKELRGLCVDSDAIKDLKMVLDIRTPLFSPVTLTSSMSTTVGDRSAVATYVTM